MAQDPDPPKVAKGSGGPVIVELFTSQGCSSCPPADAVLSKIGDKADPEIIPLAFHVDYWDYIGWKDPFASATWSNRQRAYARAMESSRVYTPQLVVNGRSHLVGSRSSAVDSAITKARAQTPVATVEVEKRVIAGDKLRATVNLELTRAAKPEHQVMVALFENNIVTSVQRGENSGRKLRNDHIVRSLSKACTLGDAKGKKTCEVIFDLEEGWNSSNMGVAAFIQDPRSMNVGGAGVSYP